MKAKSPTLVRVGTVVVAALAVLSAVLVGTRDDPRTVTAYFSDASPLVPGNEVKMAGVTVGEIRSIRVRNGLARVEMALDEAAPPLHRDARAQITAKDLLGERFVTLDGGTPSAPLLTDAASIDARHTSREVDLQEVLDTVDNPTGTALAAMISALGQGADGNGKKVAAAYRALAPAMKQSEALAQVLSEQNTMLGELLDSAEPVAEAMAADRGRRLDRLVGSTTEVLEATAAERVALASSLKQLPETLATARRTLARLSGVSDSTAQTLAELRPFTSDLTAISAELRRFSEAADPALAALPQVLRKGEAMLDELGPLITAIAPAGGDLRSVTVSGRQLSEKALSKRLGNLMNFVQGWSLSTSSYDAISHYFRAVAPVTPKALGQAGMGAVPGAPDEPVPDLPLPKPPKLPYPPGEGDDRDKPAPRDTHSATGLTEEQERSMLDQILGGGN